MVPLGSQSYGVTEKYYLCGVQDSNEILILSESQKIFDSRTTKIIWVHDDGEQENLLWKDLLKKEEACKGMDSVMVLGMETYSIYEIDEDANQYKGSDLVMMHLNSGQSVSYNIKQKSAVIKNTQ